MAQRRKAHRVINVYGDEAIETVENAVEAAMQEGAADETDALRALARAYTGYDAAE